MEAKHLQTCRRLQPKRSSHLVTGRLAYWGSANSMGPEFREKRKRSLGLAYVRPMNIQSLAAALKNRISLHH